MMISSSGFATGITKSGLGELGPLTYGAPLKVSWPTSFNASLSLSGRASMTCGPTSLLPSRRTLILNEAFGHEDIVRRPDAPPEGSRNARRFHPQILDVHVREDIGQIDRALGGVGVETIVERRREPSRNDRRPGADGITVQMDRARPQRAMPQPNLVPVMPKTSRNTHKRGVSASTSAVRSMPLTLIL
jgi:hypothetical protein